MAGRKPRTFKVRKPPMRGSDVKAFQGTLNGVLRSWGIDLRLKSDGIYGVGSRSVCAMVCRAMGFEAKRLMADGVTPELRTKIRHRRRTPAEQRRFEQRKGYREKLQRRYEDKAVAAIVGKVITDDWGYVPGRHDGVDVITLPDAPVYAICDAKVVRVTDDWWGKGSPGGSTADKGDGAIILECLVNVGPFKKGDIFVYGHAEKPRVKEGDRVQAGQMIGRSGFANAWHIHFCKRGPRDAKDRAAGYVRGVGTADPRPYLDYARKHG